MYSPAAAVLADGACTASSDCGIGGVCALSEADATAGLVCCTSGDSKYVTGVGNVCTGLAVGMKCGGENPVCASGVCGMDNVCKQEPFWDESPCKNNDQCESKMCARSEADASAGLVCCTRGGTEWVTGIGNVCTWRAAGKKCGEENGVCASGVCGMDNLCERELIGDESPCRINDQCASKMCARSEADTDAGLVCCTSGSSKQVSTLPYSPTRWVCTGLAAGMKCGGENGVCASGVCGMDNLCVIGDESPCNTNDQCESKMCARSEADTDAGLVCCTSGDSVYFHDPWLVLQYMFTQEYIKPVCTWRAAGMKCRGEDILCRSGSCGSNELCTKQLDGSSCNGNNDDCENDTCGQVEAVQGAEFICCPSGKTLTGGSSSLRVCTNIGEENQACFDDSICKSNVCLSGVCQGSKKWGDEPCEKDAHCHSGQCNKSQDSDGLGSCQPFASLAAKNDYINDSADCPLDTLIPPDASDASSGSVSISITVAGWHWDPLYENAPEFFMFGPEVLGGVDKCLGSFVAQRQGSQVCFSYQVRLWPSFIPCSFDVYMFSSPDFITVLYALTITTDTDRGRQW